MNLLYLQEFLILAETESYSKAADRLYMNQSTLSKHIKALETELGVNLFDRTTRQVRLTEYGQHLLPYAKQISALTCQYECELRRKSENLLTIGTIPTMAQYDIVELILAFKEANPQIRVRIVEGDTLELRQGLLNQQYELAFLRDGSAAFSMPNDSDDLLVKTKYQTDHIVAVIPRQHPLYGRKEITLPMLKDHKLCLLKEGTFLYETCVRACHAADFVPDIFFESHRISNIIDMSVKGNCVALLLDQYLHYSATRKQMLDGLFSVVPVVPSIKTTVSLCYLKNEMLSAPAKVFLQFINTFSQNWNE